MVEDVQSKQVSREKEVRGYIAEGFWPAAGRWARMRRSLLARRLFCAEAWCCIALLLLLSSTGLSAPDFDRSLFCIQRWVLCLQACCLPRCLLPSQTRTLSPPAPRRVRVSGSRTYTAAAGRNLPPLRVPMAVDPVYLVFANRISVRQPVGRQNPRRRRRVQQPEGAARAGRAHALVRPAMSLLYNGAIASRQSRQAPQVSTRKHASLPSSLRGVRCRPTIGARPRPRARPPP